MEIRYVEFRINVLSFEVTPIWGQWKKGFLFFYSTTPLPQYVRTSAFEDIICASSLLCMCACIGAWALFVLICMNFVSVWQFLWENNVCETACTVIKFLSWISHQLEWPSFVLKFDWKCWCHFHADGDKLFSLSPSLSLSLSLSLSA